MPAEEGFRLQIIRVLVQDLLQIRSQLLAAFLVSFLSLSAFSLSVSVFGVFRLFLLGLLFEKGVKGVDVHPLVV